MVPVRPVAPSPDAAANTPVGNARENTGKEAGAAQAALGDGRHLPHPVIRCNLYPISYLYNRPRPVSPFFRPLPCIPGV